MRNGTGWCSKRGFIEECSEKHERIKVPLWGGYLLGMDIKIHVKGQKVDCGFLNKELLNKESNKE